jgi:hypothetical protein
MYMINSTKQKKTKVFELVSKLVIVNYFLFRDVKWEEADCEYACAHIHPLRCAEAFL